jgi:hypothetical protein
MLYQIYAVYDRSKKLLIILAVLFTVEVLSIPLLLGLPLATTPFATASELSSKLPGMVEPFSGLTGCFQESNGKYADFFVWIPPLAFETILCLLMVYKAWKMYRDDWNNPLMKLLIRDR